TMRMIRRRLMPACSPSPPPAKHGDTAWSDGGHGEGVAAADGVRLVAVEEPPLALLGGPVGEGLGAHLAPHLLLDAVVADGGGGIEPVGDVSITEVLDKAGVDRPLGPHAGEAVGL